MYNIAVPASHYTHDELAEIYNQTRIDYIVPMPMNGRRMGEYIENYDISLGASIVATTEDGNPIGIAMLGLRDTRAWITRLGVLPNQRERRVGSFLMEHLIAQAKQCNADLIQLEVIVGNEPARGMFVKFGFQQTRELLIARRPPKPHVAGTHPLIHELTHIDEDQIPEYLSKREHGASWVEESASLLNGGDLKGIKIMMGDGEGWAVFMCTRFQIQHIILWATDIHRDEIYTALLYYIHELFPNRDTKVENIPTDHPTWKAFTRLEYVVSFKRTEMVLTLN